MYYTAIKVHEYAQEEKAGYIGMRPWAGLVIVGDDWMNWIEEDDDDQDMAMQNNLKPYF